MLLLLVVSLSISFASSQSTRLCSVLPTDSPDASFLQVLRETFAPLSLSCGDGRIRCEELRESVSVAWGPCSLAEVVIGPLATNAQREDLTLPNLPNLRKFQILRAPGVKRFTIEVSNDVVEWRSPYIDIRSPDLLTVSSNGNAKVWKRKPGTSSGSLYIDGSGKTTVSFPFLEYIDHGTFFSRCSDVQLPRLSHMNGYSVFSHYFGESFSLPSLVWHEGWLQFHSSTFKRLDLPKFRGNYNTFLRISNATQLEQLVLPELGLPVTSYSGSAYPYVGVGKIIVENSPLLNFIRAPELVGHQDMTFEQLPSLRKLCFPKLAGPMISYYSHSIRVVGTALRELSIPNGSFSGAVVRENPELYSIHLRIVNQMLSLGGNSKLSCINFQALYSLLVANAQSEPPLASFCLERTPSSSVTIDPYFLAAPGCDRTKCPVEDSCVPPNSGPPPIPLCARLAHFDRASGSSGKFSISADGCNGPEFRLTCHLLSLEERNAQGTGRKQHVPNFQNLEQSELGQVEKFGVMATGYQISGMLRGADGDARIKITLYYFDTESAVVPESGIVVDRYSVKFDVQVENWQPVAPGNTLALTMDFHASPAKNWTWIEEGSFSLVSDEGARVQIPKEQGSTVGVFRRGNSLQHILVNVSWVTGSAATETYSYDPVMSHPMFSASSSSFSSGGPNVGAIIGGVVAALVVLEAVIVLMIIFKPWKQFASVAKPSSSEATLAAAASVE